MITTGIIKQININGGNYYANKYLVEINLFQIPGDRDKSNYTYEANCAAAGGLYASYKTGDTVYIGFLNESLSLPIILGHIYQGLEEAARSYALLESLKVLGPTELSEQTTIGEISYTQLRNNMKDVNMLKETSKLYQHNIKFSLGEKHPELDWFGDWNAQIKLINRYAFPYLDSDNDFYNELYRVNGVQKYNTDFNNGTLICPVTLCHDADVITGQIFIFMPFLNIGDDVYDIEPYIFADGGRISIESFTDTVVPI